MTLTRRTALTLIAATPLALSLRPALAAQPKWFLTDGVALRGYDAVAYFTEGTHVAGDAAHALDWDGARWLFSSAANRDAFAADTDRFAPRYGGYCAYAVSKGSTAPTEPDAWTVHEDRLYMNFNTSVRSLWREDIPGNVAKADANWPGVLG